MFDVIYTWQKEKSFLRINVFVITIYSYVKYIWVGSEKHSKLEDRGYLGISFHTRCIGSLYSTLPKNVDVSAEAFTTIKSYVRAIPLIWLLSSKTWNSEHLEPHTSKTIGEFTDPV